MLIENMQMAFFAIRINKMRSILTMLGIIIGIGSVISIVSIGDTMRAMFASTAAPPQARKRCTREPALIFPMRESTGITRTCSR